MCTRVITKLIHLSIPPLIQTGFQLSLPIGSKSGVSSCLVTVVGILYHCNSRHYKVQPLTLVTNTLFQRTEQTCSYLSSEGIYLHLHLNSLNVIQHLKHKMIADKMPHLQVFEKLRQIPLVEIAYNTSAGVYKRVKDCNGLVHWTLNGAEGAFQIALGAVTPVAVKLQQPINLVDDTLCKGIDVLQEKVPIVKEPPGQIYESAKSYVSNSAAAGKVQSITTKSWEKANEVLCTSYGNMALNGLDTTSTIADKYIDYYLPAEEDEENIHPHPNSECQDKVLHTVHTVGTLSAKVSRRVYRTLSGSRKRQERNDGQNPQDINNPQMDSTSSQNTENLTHRKPSSDTDQYNG